MDVYHPCNGLRLGNAYALTISRSTPSREKVTKVLTVVDPLGPIGFFPVVSTGAVEWLDVLVTRWFCLFDPPEAFFSDNGRAFRSTLGQMICSSLQIRQLFSGPHAPWMNGIAERAQQCLLVALRSLPPSEKDMWHMALPMVTRAEMVAIPPSGVSRYEVTFGRPPVSPLDLMLSSDLAAQRSLSPSVVDATSLVPSLRAARQVVQAYAAASRAWYLSRSLETKSLRKVGSPHFFKGVRVVYYRPTDSNKKTLLQFRGPYEVVDQLGSGLFRLKELSSGKILDNASAEHMQLYKPKPDVPILEDEVPPHQDTSAITSLELPPPGSLVAFRHKVGYLLGLVEGSAEPDEEDTEPFISLHLYAPQGSPLRWFPVWFDSKDGKAFLSWRQSAPDRRWIMPVPKSSIIAVVTLKTPLPHQKPGLLSDESRTVLLDLKPSRLQ